MLISLMKIKGVRMETDIEKVVSLLSEMAEPRTVMKEPEASQNNLEKHFTSGPIEAV